MPNCSQNMKSILEMLFVKGKVALQRVCRRVRSEDQRVALEDLGIEYVECSRRMAFPIVENKSHA